MQHVVLGRRAVGTVYTDSLPVSSLGSPHWYLPQSLGGREGKRAFDIKLIRHSNPGEVKGAPELHFPSCYILSTGRHDQVKRMKSMWGNCREGTPCSFVGLLALRVRNVKKFHSKVFQPSDCANFLTRRTWPVYCLHQEHWDLWPRPSSAPWLSGPDGLALWLSLLSQASWEQSTPFPWLCLPEEQ